MDMQLMMKTKQHCQEGNSKY